MTALSKDVIDVSVVSTDVMAPIRCKVVRQRGKEYSSKRSRQILTSLSETVLCLMRIQQARVLLGAIQCLMMT